MCKYRDELLRGYAENALKHLKDAAKLVEEYLEADKLTTKTGKIIESIDDLRVFAYEHVLIAKRSLLTKEKPPRNDSGYPY